MKSKNNSFYQKGVSKDKNHSFYQNGTFKKESSFKKSFPENSYNQKKSVFTLEIRLKN